MNLGTKRKALFDGILMCASNVIFIFFSRTVYNNNNNNNQRSKTKALPSVCPHLNINFDQIDRMNSTYRMRCIKTICHTHLSILYCFFFCSYIIFNRNWIFQDKHKWWAKILYWTIIDCWIYSEGFFDFRQQETK